MSKTNFFLVSILIAAAGCFGGDGDEDSATATDGFVFGADAPFSLDHSTEGCHEGVLVFLRDFASLQEFLPQGFTAADASVLFGLPAPLGRGAALFHVEHCAMSKLENGPYDVIELSVPVEAPSIDVEGPVAAGHFYMVQFGQAQGRTGEVLRAVGVPVANGTTSFGPGGLLPPLMDEFSFTENGTVSFQAAVLTGPPVPLQGNNRFWHVTPLGTLYIDYDVDTNALAGHDVTCEVNPDSLAGRLAGPGACGITNLLNRVALVIPDFGWKGTIAWTPDVFPA